MHRALQPAGIACLLTVLALAPANAASLRVLDTDPPAGGSLHVGETLYVRLSYTADEPVRFRARGFLYGTERRAGTRTNPSPPYPHGQGEALVWIEYTAPDAIDELRIESYDSSWTLLETMVLPVAFEWHSGARASSRSQAAWVAPLSAAQQQMTSVAMTQHADEDGPWVLLIMIAGWSIPAYFILQVWLYRRWHGGWRKAALLPLPATIPILAYTVFALVRGSNLWPLVMLFTLPFAFAYLLALVLAKRVITARRSGGRTRSPRPPPATRRAGR